MSWDTSKKTGRIVAVFRALRAPVASATPTATVAATELPSAIPGWDLAYYRCESDHPPAVVEIVWQSATDTFVIDAIGDMTSRTEAVVTWTSPSVRRGGWPERPTPARRMPGASAITVTESGSSRTTLMARQRCSWAAAPMKRR
jgi:hypothetical protein